MKVSKKLSALLLAVLMLVCSLPTTAFAAQTSFTVSSEEEFVSAVQSANSSGAGNCTVSLNSDMLRRQKKPLTKDGEKMEYKVPELEIIKFNTADVLCNKRSYKPKN